MASRTLARLALALLPLLAAPVPAAAQGPVYPAEPVAPDRGPPPREPLAPPAPAWTLSGSVGAGTSYGGTYLLVGARLSRALAACLSLDVEGQYWVGGSPSLAKVAPGLTWVSPGGVYLGTYYARWLVGAGLPDQDAVGARAGVVMARTGAASASVGVAYERALGCSYGCESWWPEAAGLRF